MSRAPIGGARTSVGLGAWDRSTRHAWRIGSTRVSVFENRRTQRAASVYTRPPIASRSYVPAAATRGAHHAVPAPPSKGGRELPRLHRVHELLPAVHHVLRRDAEQDVPRHHPLLPFREEPGEDRDRIRERARADRILEGSREVADLA